MKGLNLIMGARNGAKTEREENDFYATHPHATQLFLEKLKVDHINIGDYIWEPCTGNGHMAQALRAYGYIVTTSDIIQRVYPLDKIEDFLKTNVEYTINSIVTNPPFKDSLNICEKALEIVGKNSWVCMFVKIQFLEGKARKELFLKYPPKYVYVYSERQHTAKNGDFETYQAKTQAYCWVMWQKGYDGETTLRWI